MKKIFAMLSIITMFTFGCKKGNEVKIDTTVTPVEKPAAAFQINNLVSDNLILEGNIIDFKNASKTADSYYWDFGNGNYSTEKVPQNISFVPCGENYTISLTVKNKSGEATYAQTYNILCRGKNAHSAGPIKPVHLSTAQIATLPLD